MQRTFRRGRQLRMALHRIHLGAEQRKQRRHIAGTGADFENAVGSLKSKVLEHRGHDVRLRDGLPLADGQWMILVRVLPKSLRNKLVSRHFAHSLKNPPIPNATIANLLANHSSTLY